MKEMIHHERPFVLYNAEKKIPIGLFKSISYVAKYLEINYMTAYNSAMRRGVIIKSAMSFRVAIRFANEEHIKTLGPNEVVMIDESAKKFNHNIVKGFYTERGLLCKPHPSRKIKS